MITDNTEIHLLTNDIKDSFISKRNLNSIEKYALECALCQFIQEWEEENYGEFCTKDIKNYIRWNEHYIDILDGYYDTYIFNNYAIDKITMTDNGILLLHCYEVEPNEYGEFLPENINRDKDVVFRLN